jgi:hypothetical protein
LYFSAGGANNTWTIYRCDGTAAGTRGDDARQLLHRPHHRRL